MVVNVVIRTVPAAVDNCLNTRPVPVSVVPRTSLAPVFDCLWREKMETEGLGTRVQVPVVTRSSDRWETQPKNQQNRFVLLVSEEPSEMCS